MASTENAGGFLNETRLLKGPWQAFERDVARLFLQNGFDDVRLVGGTGDKGGDILAVKDGKLWVIQCKYSSTSPPPAEAVDEVIRAGSFYGADKLRVAVSRPASTAMKARVRRERARCLDIEIAEPAQLLTWMTNSPEYPPSCKKLRTYQQEAADVLRNALVDTGRGQIVLATGLGKTVILAEVVATLLREGLIRDGRVLVLAHTLPLVNQLTQEFWYQLPRDVACHQLVGEERPSYWDGITFATIQSAEHYLALPAFGLVIVDEAHHIGAATFQKTVAALDSPMLAGATATPWRGDGYDIDSILGPPLVQMGIPEGLRGGHLSDVDYRLLADNIDWKVVQKASVNRYSLSQLNRHLIIPTRDDLAARMVAESFATEKRRAAIAYCPSAVHAREFAAKLRQYGLRAEPILHDTERRMRARMMSRFRAGDLDVVTTVDLFNEGVDVPDADMIVFMRVTHSRRIFVQQLGRGLRCSPGKNRVLVLDFVTDLRRIAEVIELDRATRGGDVERLGLGSSIVSFTDQSAGSFLKEWMLDQASLMLRKEDPHLQMPDLHFPVPPGPGGIQ
ncbi:MAG: DEAD/DEAH box helicase family protein [candidate division WOR-3 bacterium]|nr:DEAD/DEAH box helicase family protein [candidate division WOR-3 bacterium]